MHCNLRVQSVGVLLACAIATFSIPFAEAQTFPDPPGGTYDFTATGNGAWHTPATWGTVSQIPGDGDRVLIPSGFRVTVQRLEDSRIRFIRVEGELRLWIHSDSRLKTETLYVAPDSTLRIGNVSNPVKAGVQAEIVLLSSQTPIDAVWDPKQLSRGLVSDGQIRLFGEEKAHMVTTSRNVRAGATGMLVDRAVDTTLVGWQDGDEVVIPGTVFARVAGESSSQDERRSVTVSGNRLTFASPLIHDHLRVAAHLKLHVVNLTRNLVIRSEHDQPIADRGHFMIRNSDVDIRHIALIGLGRTDKSVPLDDIDVNLVVGPPQTYTLQSPSTISNRRGRYSLHFHRNGIQPNAATPPSKVYGSVVIDAVGWGFVNHSSHVDFRENIAYDFVGAGFVTEAGDELGNFYDNVAIRGTGNGEYRKVRLVFKNTARPQPLSDFGFSGDGFWFQGPAIRVRNNVASGCDGAGMIFFTTGAPEIDQTFAVGSNIHNRYAYFFENDLDAIYGSQPTWTPRRWDHGTPAEPRVVISDLPILEMDGFDAYGNFVGFRLRFNNNGNGSWYGENPFDYNVHYSSTGPTPILRQEISNLRLWNNEQGFRTRYSQQGDWDNVEVINRLAYTDPIGGDVFVGHDGAEFFHATTGMVFTNLSIDGYPIAGWLVRDDPASANGVDFMLPNPPDYANYANFEVWDKTQACGPAFWNATMASTTTAQLSWTPASTHMRFLVIYRAVGDQAWTFTETTTPSISLSGLSPSTAYEAKVVGSCWVGGAELSLSRWAVTTFSTL